MAGDAGGDRTVEGSPSSLGALLQVVPVAVTQRRGARALSLAGVECWERCTLTTFHLGRPQFDEWPIHSELVVEATDDAGFRYAAAPEHGGGSGDDHQVRYSFVVRLTPPLGGQATRLRLTAEIHRYVVQEVMRDGRPSSEAVGIPSDEEPWTFDVPLHGGATPAPPPPDDPRPAAGALSTLRRLIPVVQTETWEGWVVTCVSVELWDDGWGVTFRVILPGPDRWVPALVLRPTDDRGATYRSTAGSAGTGSHGPETGGCEWRLSHHFAPAVDPRSSELRLVIEEGRLTEGRPIGIDPSTERRSERWDWTLTVPLV
jgi:hypothetical protein